MKDITIYAIVVTYNGAKWINKCFGSLINSSIPLKVIAIDNNSQDRTPDLIRENFPEVEVVETGDNLGFGKANNIGLKRVLDENADYAFLLNQDAWVEVDTIEKLLRSGNNNKEYGILSPVQFFKKGKLDYKFEKFYASQELLQNINTNKIEDIVFKVDFVNAAGWLINRNIVYTCGFFDPVFFHYGEDVDYVNKVKDAGYHIGIVANTNYYHDRPQVEVKDTETLKKINHFFISQLLYKRWGKQNIIYKEVLILKLYLKLILDLIKTKEFKNAMILSRKYLTQISVTFSVLNTNTTKSN